MKQGDSGEDLHLNGMKPCVKAKLQGYKQWRKDE